MEIYNDDEFRNESVDAQTPPPQSCAHGTSTGSGDWLDRMADGRASSILREVSSRRSVKRDTGLPYPHARRQRITEIPLSHGNLSDSRETTGFRVVKSWSENSMYT